MLTKITNLNQRTLCGIGAGAVAVSLILGGVFAWADNSQHKTNVAKGGGEQVLNDVVLVENYEETDDWQEDDELTKEISVKNTGEGQVYVRIQLKEYMEIAEVKYEYSAERLLTDESGKFVSGATQKDLTDWLDAKGVPYKASQIKQYRAYGEPETAAEKFFLATDETTNINGREGKFLLLNYTESAPESLVTGVDRAEYIDVGDHQLNPTGECKYTPHLWSANASDPFHQYVEWTLGAPVIRLVADNWDGKPVAAWILDDSADGKGYAYWGESLKSGEETAKLLENITLANQPSGPFYYALHVDMQAADMSQLKSTFKGMPETVEKSYRGEIWLAVSADSQTAKPGEFVQFAVKWNGLDVTDQIDWSTATVEKGTATLIRPATKFDETGKLKIGPAQVPGTIIVTVKFTPTGGTEQTQKFVITVRKPAE